MHRTSLLFCNMANKCTVISQSVNCITNSCIWNTCVTWQGISVFHRAFFNSVIDKTPTHALFIQHYISLSCWFIKIHI